MEIMTEIKAIVKKFKDKSLQEKIIMCEKHWKSVSLFITSVATAIFILCRMLYFSYYKGAYSVYHLEDSYIDMSNETIIIRIAKTLFVMSVIFVSNYVFYVIGTSKDTGRIRLKRKLKTIVYILFEILILVFISTLETNFSTSEVINEFSKASRSEIIGIVILTLYTSLLINIFAIQICIRKNDRIFRYIYNKIIKPIIQKLKIDSAHSSQTEINNEDSNQKDYGWIIFCIIIIIMALCLEMTLLYSFGKSNELSRKEYKVIVQNVENNENSQFNIDGKDVEIYIIIYENKEECVVSKLENKNGKVTRRLEENKKIKKENLEIYYCDDIYEICNCLTL